MKASPKAITGFKIAKEFKGRNLIQKCFKMIETRIDVTPSYVLNIHKD